MPYTVTYDAEARWILIDYRGSVSLPEIRALTEDVGRLAQEHACRRVLSDFREASVALSTMEIHKMPKVIAEVLSAAGLQVHQLKRALVVASDFDDFSFFEDVSQNRAQTVKLFRDIDQATDWLSRQ